MNRICEKLFITPLKKYSNSDIVDAVVIGTGAGGAPVLARLANAGLKVIALEAGKFFNPSTEFATDEREQEKIFWQFERLSAGKNPLAFGKNNSGIGVGGSTIHYTAYTPRPQPDDFKIYSEFGKGTNWPIGYYDLEKYYDELEMFLGISGPSPYPWGPVRKSHYPLQHLNFSNIYVDCMEIYMDDLTIYGTTFEEAKENLEKVLKRCQDYNLSLNNEKCYMMMEGVVLGHFISP